MRNWSVPLARMGGTEVRLHLTFLLLLLYVWLTETVTPNGVGALRPAALAAIVLGSVALHETGHVLAGRHRIVRTRSVVLLPIGGIALVDDPAAAPPGIARELRIALAGPVVNLVLAALIAAAGMAAVPQNFMVQPLVHSANLLRSAIWVNVFLGVLNLLPAYPLDGGRVLRAYFQGQMDSVAATRRAVVVGQLFSTALIFVGIWNPWLMLVGFFVFVGAQLEDRSAVFQSVLQTVRMEDVMLTGFATLSPADTLEDALHKAVHTLQDDFPVIRGSDMVGVISRQRILEHLRSGGNGYVQTAMQRAFDVAQRRDSLASAFRKITGSGATLIPIVEDEHLIGIVTLQNLMHSMALLAETRRLARKHKET
jgi:Zn-dependent protease/CBS domain-containing protein